MAKGLKPRGNRDFEWTEDGMDFVQTYGRLNKGEVLRCLHHKTLHHSLHYACNCVLLYWAMMQ
jgi:hypothetical protein